SGCGDEGYRRVRKGKARSEGGGLYPAVRPLWGNLFDRRTFRSGIDPGSTSQDDGRRRILGSRAEGGRSQRPPDDGAVAVRIAYGPLTQPLGTSGLLWARSLTARFSIRVEIAHLHGKACGHRPRPQKTRSVRRAA